MSLPLSPLKAARASHAKGDFAAAIRGYESICRREPQNYEVAYLLAVAYYQASQLEKAASQFAAAARLNPRRNEPHKDRGLVLMKLGRHGEAADAFGAALKCLPHSPELLLNRGLALKNAGRLQEAVQSYRAALAAKPDFAEAFNNLGNALDRLGSKTEAVEAYARATALKPDYAEAQLNAAEVLVSLQRTDEAEALLDTFIARNPRHAAAHRALAQCLNAAGRAEEALAAANRAIALAPNSADSYLTRAFLREEANRDDEASPDFEKALTLEPRNVSALIGFARLLGRSSRHEEAVALCDRAISAEPANPQGYFWIGQIFEVQRKLMAAVDSYDKVLELDPANSDAALRRAKALGDLDQHNEALDAFDKIILADPRSVEAHRWRGEVLRALKRYGEATAAFDTAIRLKPEQPQLYGARAALWTDMGRQDEAIADIGESLALLGGASTVARLMVDDCKKLLSVDRIPAIYTNEAELQETRTRVEAILDALAEKCEASPPPGLEERKVAEQALRHLTGFYLAYHQRNDRETMQKLSRVVTWLLAPDPYQFKKTHGHGKIRLGIASQHLRNHNGANWAYNWLKQLPSTDYEFFTYRFGADTDPLGQKFTTLGTHRQLRWSADNPHDALDILRGDQLDVLMLPDVGMTSVSRFLSVHRLAPRQFTAWGHPVTTGSPEMDFYLSSDLMEPANAQDHYSEKLVRLPNLALFLDPPENAEETPGEERFGLPEGRVLYGCLQSLFKYLPRYDHLFPRIAQEVPNALFVFIEGEPSYMTQVMRQRLDAAFAADGMAAERHVVFVPRQKERDFSRLMKAMDVSMDSVGWSGGNTSLKSIALGTPLATLDGEFMRGRHTSAMFRMMGTGELIAGTADQYVDVLVRLGRDQDYRHHCSTLLRTNRGKLYEDRAVIAAFDNFLKTAPASSLF